MAPTVLGARPVPPGRAPAPGAGRWARRSAALLAAGLLAGCGAPAAGDGPPAAAPSASPSPSPSVTATAPVGPQVPVQDAALGAQPPAPAVPAPTRLSVPDLGIDMPVDAVGVEDDGSMEIPEDAGRAGWYRFGPAPATPEGATVVAAHVDSWSTGIGPFSRLRDVRPGARVEVTTADGTVHAYVVREVAQIPKQDAPVEQWFDRTGAPRLVLVTCGGAFDREVGHYADNVAVTAEPAPAAPAG